MTKIWHPYWTWEDIGMWRKASKKEEKLLIQKAIEFTGNTELYGEWMLKVIEQYEYACQHNLTDSSINQRAWIGHAACHMAIDAPEYITRHAWGFLTDKQQLEANCKADFAINLWNFQNEKPRAKIHNEMGVSGLQKRDTGRIPVELGIIGESSFVSHDMQSDTQKRLDFC